MFQRPWVMAGLVALAAGLGATRAVDLNAPPRFDGAGYAVLAESLAEGRGYREIDHPDAPRHGHFPPGYPAWLALLWSAAGRSARAGHVGSLVCTSAAAVAAWAWFRKLYGPKVAGLLGLAVAANWTWHRNGGSIQSEPLYLLVSGLTLLAATAVGRRGGPVSGAGLGALLAAGVLTRHVAGPVALAVVADLLWRRKAATAAAAGLTCLVLVAPWAAWLFAVRENTQAAHLTRGGLPERVAAQGLFYLQRLPDALTGPFVEVATVFRTSGPVALAANAWAALASALIVAGWLLTLRSPRRRLAGLAALATLALLLVWPFTEAGRFLVPLVPLIVVGATEGLARLIRAAGPGGRRARTLAATALLAASLPYPIYALIGDRSAAARKTYGDFDAACGWLAREATSPGPVLTRHPGEVYWQTGRNALTPQSTQPSTVESLVDRYGVAYLLVDVGRYANAPENPLSAFVEARPGRVREVWRRESPGAAVVIYEVRPAP